MSAERCINCGKRVEWVILGINLGLFLVKGSFAFISHSKSLQTDAFQSLANLIITIVVLISIKMAAKGADKKFPYGYGKVEFLASGIVNMLLMFAAIAFIFMSFSEMVTVGPEKTPNLIAIVAAAISIVANYIAFGYGRCAGEKLASTAILAYAQVSRADVGTSIAVIVAVVGSNMGFSQLDHIVAIVIGLLIIKVTWDGTKKAIKGLMDVSLRSEELHILNLLEDIKGVQRVEDVKVRLAGRSLLVDLNVFVPEGWLLSKGLQTSERIKNVLQKKMKNISDVSVQLLPITIADSRGRRPANPKST